MAGHNGKQKITLEQLLELKRHERPGGEFWDSFEHDFQRRRLHALVEKGAIRESIWNPVLKAVAFGMPALLLIGFAMFWSRTETSPVPTSPLFVEETASLQAAPASPESLPGRRATAAEDRRPAIRTDLASSQFVVDAIQSESGPAMSFTKVLYTPAIRLSTPSGASYVRDNLSSSQYQVTSAELKLGRNF